MGRDLNILLQQNLLARYPGKFEFEKHVQYNCSNFYSNLGQDCIALRFNSDRYEIAITKSDFSGDLDMFD
jgi:hypothetical protein